MSSSTVILLVDDDEIFRARMARGWQRRGYGVLSACNLAEARGYIATRRIQRAIVDLRLAGETGMDLLAELKRAQPQCQTLMLTGYGSIPSAWKAQQLGAQGYLTKPVEMAELERAFEGQGEQPDDAADESPMQSTPSLARVEWEHIQRVLADCNGNISQAARVLGIHRRSLQRKLAKFPSKRLVPAGLRPNATSPVPPGALSKPHGT